MKTTSNINKIKVFDRKQSYEWIYIDHTLGFLMVCHYGLGNLRLCDFIRKALKVLPSEHGFLNFVFFDKLRMPYKNLKVRVSEAKSYILMLDEQKNV